ncbi:response regulator [Zhongshania guokunii]|uniref:Response regulator n=1 Tax=Zhongshania guokunii TaxID=641783 RepID=A0ABV3U6L3_9GAMM
MRILIVEDEQLLLEQLRRQFEQADYACDCAADGAEGLFLGQENPYDLAIVDLGLPKLDGISLIKQWRSEGRKFPVLILTARDRWQDKVEGLESGADDYVAKPFQIEEVMARANALIRRSAGFASPQLEFGCLTIDTGAKRALLNKQALELTAYEYNALEFMAMRSGQVVSKTDLTEHLYDQDFDRDSNVIEVFIARLRKKIDPSNTLKPISTLRGRGYRFELSETQH